MSDVVREYLAAAVADRRMPGAAWWIGTVDGPLSHGSVGNAEPDTIYDLASLTKPLVTAPLLLLLEQDRRLALEQPIGDLLPELSGSDHAQSTVFELATHTAGLPAWRPLYLAAHGIEAVLREIASEPRVPDAPAVYSDLGYLCLGELVARAGGAALDRQFEARIATPLGLKHTGFSTHRDLSMAAPTEHGNQFERELAGAAGGDYAWRTVPIQAAVHDVNAYALGGVAGHAGLFGPAAEVASLALEFLHPRKLALSPVSQRKLLTEACPGSGRTVGLVLAAASEAALDVLPPHAPGHVGFTGTSFWLDPQRSAVYVLLTNRVCPRVDGRDFQALRSGFHRQAQRLF